MRVASKFATLLAATICTSSAMAQIVDSPPTHAVRGVTVAADEVTSPSMASTSTVRITMQVEDLIQGTSEEWKVVHTTNTLNRSCLSSLDVGGAPRYIIQQAYIGDDLYVSVQTVAGYDWVNLADYNSRPLYASLIASIEFERMLVLDVVHELQEFGTVQATAPAFLIPGANVVEFPTPPTHSEVDCREEAIGLFGPKPTDCEGAIDEYICCIWEFHVDAAEDACECDKKPWYKRIACYALITIPAGIDGVACVISLPIPGN